MPQPIAFISRFRVKEGTLEALRRYVADSTAALEADKPRTLVFGMYLDEEATRLSILHAFADSDSMDVHFEGAADRSRVAFESLRPEGWEVYGAPSLEAMATLRKAAAAAGVELAVWPEHLAGFMRLAPAPG
jgi:quinol monooxygenase YgiN